MVSDFYNSKKEIEKNTIPDGITNNEVKLDYFTLLKWIETTTDEVYLVWNRKGKLIYVTETIKELLGYHSNSLKNTSVKEMVEDSYVDLLKNSFDKHSTKKQYFSLRLQHCDGSNVWCECIISRMTLNKDYVYMGTLKDVTDKVEMEEIMIQSEKMSIAGQLAAGVAHEIRNPLTALKGFLQLLQAGIDHKDEYYKIMIDEVNKMETVTSEMLFISKPMTDQKREESIHEMIKDVITLLKPQAKLKNIEIVIQGDKNAYLHCDKSQIKQVLINILKNAIEAMSEPGSVVIKIQSSNSQLVIDIVDEGVGVPEEVIHKLSEPFFTTKKSGTGLGLMITKEILKKHNALMNIFQNPDKGSTFRFTFYKDEVNR